MEIAGNYTNPDWEVNLLNLDNNYQEIPIDNTGQKGKTIFIFEGKKNKKQKNAFGQLRKSKISLNFFKGYYISKEFFQKFVNIRMFYYSLKRKTLIEFDNTKNKPIILQTFKFKDLNELSEILRKL